MPRGEHLRAAAVWCPDWPAVAAARAERIGAEQPLVVVDQRGVVACNAAARAAGVRRGLRRRDAQFRCPEAAILTADPRRDAMLFEPVVRALDEVVAGTELLRPGLIALAASGALRYYGDAHSLVEALVNAVAEVDVECLVGIADELPTACFAARAGDCVQPGQDAAYLAGRPLQMLAAEPALLSGAQLDELLDLLHRLGVRTMGDFAALNAADVASRFGALGTAAHRIASAQRWRLPSISTPPPEMAVSTACEPPLERVDSAAFLGRRLAVQLHTQLAAAGMACVRLAVKARLTDGREVTRVWRCAEPLSAAATADRVRWQLEGWLSAAAAAAADEQRRAGVTDSSSAVFDEAEATPAVGAGIAALTVDPLEVVPAGHLQEGLWGSAGLAEGRALRALQRVQGLLGIEAVRVATPCGGRAPAAQISTHAYGDADASVQSLSGSGEGTWIGSITGPSPAVVTPAAGYRLRIHRAGQSRAVPLGEGLELLDSAGERLVVSRRGMLSGVPNRLRLGALLLELRGWSAPWPVDDGWWRGEELRVHMQVAPADTAALLLATSVETSRWTVAGVYE